MNDALPEVFGYLVIAGLIAFVGYRHVCAIRYRRAVDQTYIGDTLIDLVGIEFEAPPEKRPRITAK